MRTRENYLEEYLSKSFLSVHLILFNSLATPLKYLPITLKIFSLKFLIWLIKSSLSVFNIQFGFPFLYVYLLEL